MPLREGTNCLALKNSWISVGESWGYSQAVVLRIHDCSRMSHRARVRYTGLQLANQIFLSPILLSSPHTPCSSRPAVRGRFCQLSVRPTMRRCTNTRGLSRPGYWKCSESRRRSTLDRNTLPQQLVHTSDNSLTAPSMGRRYGTHFAASTSTGLSISP